MYQHALTQRQKLRAVKAPRLAKMYAYLNLRGFDALHAWRQIDYGVYWGQKVTATPDDQGGGSAGVAFVGWWPIAGVQAECLICRLPGDELNMMGGPLPSVGSRSIAP